MNNIDVVVLAAGTGSRLHPLTVETPKCLIPVGGRPILGILLQQIIESSQQDVRIHIVSGHLSEKVKDFLVSQDINLIVNREYTATNNMYSLSLTFSHLEPTRELVVVNGDCIYNASIVDTIVSYPKSVIAIDSSVYYTESMKVFVHNGFVRAISKQLTPSRDIYTSIDLYKFSTDVKCKLMETVNAFIARKDLTQWTEVAINQLVQDKTIGLHVFDIAGKNWAEIDTLEDLERASKLFGQHK